MKTNKQMNNQAKQKQNKKPTAKSKKDKTEEQTKKQTKQKRVLLHYKLSAAERSVTGRAICLIISCCGF